MTANSTGGPFDFHLAAFSTAITCTTLVILVYIVAAIRYKNHWRDTIERNLIFGVTSLVPIYATSTIVSIGFPDGAIYVSIFVGVAESVVFYLFVSLIFHYIGKSDDDDDGDAATAWTAQYQYRLNVYDRELGNRLLHRILSSDSTHYPFPLCRYMIIASEGLFFEIRNRCVQFPLVNLLTVATSGILYATGFYVAGDFSPTRGYVWLLLIKAASMSVAFYALYVLHKITMSGVKMITDKLNLFTTLFNLLFWQHVVVSLFYQFGIIVVYPEWSKQNSLTLLYNILVSMELLIFMCLFVWIFFHRATASLLSTSSTYIIAATTTTSTRQEEAAEVAEDKTKNIQLDTFKVIGGNGSSGGDETRKDTKNNIVVDSSFINF